MGLISSGPGRLGMRLDCMFSSVDPLAIVFVVLSAFSGALHIWADVNEQQPLAYLFKPLTLLLLILVVSCFVENAPWIYLILIFLGLVFSLAGDVFLMLEKDLFIQGLISFFMAHICYVLAFGQFLDFNSLPWLLLLGFVVISFGIWQYLKGSLGKLKIPVLAYISIIILMSFAAGSWSIQSIGTNNSMPALLAFTGSVIFMSSDTSLAINRFKQKYKYGQVLTLSTYYVAQILLVLSAISFNPS